MVKSPLGLVLRQALSCLTCWVPTGTPAPPGRHGGRDPGRVLGEQSQPWVHLLSPDSIWFLTQPLLAEGRLWARPRGGPQGVELGGPRACWAGAGVHMIFPCMDSVHDHWMP